MKYFLSLSLILTVITSSYSQLDKKTWLIGGAGNFYSYSEEYISSFSNGREKHTSIDVSATIGYFFFDKFSVGLRPYLSTYTEGGSAVGYFDYSKFAVGPFARYYFLKKNKPYNLLTDVSYLTGINQGRSGGNLNGVFKVFSIMVGTEVFFNSSIGIEILLGYKSQLATVDNSPNDYVRTKKGFQTSISFQFHLTK